MLALTSTLSEHPIKGRENADAIVSLLDGPGAANSKSDWLKQSFIAIDFKLQTPALLILNPLGQISSTLGTWLLKYDCHKSWPWTSGYSPPEVTYPSHWLSHHTVSHRSLKDCISHHPLHQHSCSHWSRLHLRTISQSPSPNHTHYLSSGPSLALCRVLFSLAAYKSVPSVS